LRWEKKDKKTTHPQKIAQRDHDDHGSRLRFNTGLPAIRFEALGRDDARAPAQLRAASQRGSVGAFAGQAEARGHGEWGLRSWQKIQRNPKKNMGMPHFYTLKLNSQMEDIIDNH